MMNIRILGTAAAEGWPALFCDCDACNQARKLGGKNIRTRSSLLIDEVLKIDLPPDTLHHCHRDSLDLSKLSYLFFTHSHQDHLAFRELAYAFSPFALQDKAPTLSIYANAASLEVMHELCQAFEKKGLEDNITEAVPFETYVVPPFQVTPVRSHHGTEDNPLNYLVEKDDTSFLYTCDTGFYEEETWDFLSKRHVDLVISECTGGPDAVTYGTHLGFPDVLKFREKCLEIGLTDENTPWILTHFSHGGGMLHDDLVELAKPHGIEIGYDGMTITI